MQNFSPFAHIFNQIIFSVSTIYNDSTMTKNQLDRIRNHEVLTKTLFGTGIFESL